MNNSSVRNGTTEDFVCEAWMGSSSAGVFRGDDPLKYSTPLLLLLISLVTSLSSLFQALLRPLANVDFVTQILVPFYVFFFPMVITYKNIERRLDEEVLFLENSSDFFLNRNELGSFLHFFQKNMYLN